MKFIKIFRVVSMCNGPEGATTAEFGSVFSSNSRVLAEAKLAEVSGNDNGWAWHELKEELVHLVDESSDFVAQDDGTMECPSCGSQMTVNVGHCVQCGGYI